jgi:hypothetical protein
MPFAACDTTLTAARLHRRTSTSGTCSTAPNPISIGSSTASWRSKTKCRSSTSAMAHGKNLKSRICPEYTKHSRRDRPRLRNVARAIWRIQQKTLHCKTHTPHHCGQAHRAAPRPHKPGASSGMRNNPHGAAMQPEIRHPKSNSAYSARRASRARFIAAGSASPDPLT